MCAREIHPWASVTIGPTGAMPADFWTKIGASASTLVNVLVCASQPSCLGQMIYRGLVALGTFLVDLARAIVDWGMKQLGPLWNTIVAVAQKAGEVLGQVVNAIVNAGLAVIHAALDPLIRAVMDAYAAWANEVAQLILNLRNLPINDLVRGLIQATFFSVFALAIFAIIVAFSVAEKITNAMTLGLANVAGIIIGAVAGLIVGMLVVAAIGKWLGSTVIDQLLPPGFDEITGATFTVAQFLFAYELAQRPLKPIQGIETGLRDAILGLMLLGVATLVKLALGETVIGLTILVFLDAFALYKELSGIADVIKITGRGANFVKMWYPFLYPVTVVMNVVGVATAATDLAGDAGKLASKL